ncbi:MAG TPA: hypothetical protein DCR40_10965, partial [Prolixibacteraceae bacterium]|nr:hypothetical protein [Prolixibacteraceae bacterium]
PAGNPLNTTLPVDSSQVGCVMVPTIGAPEAALIITLTEAKDVHRAAFVTVKLYVPAARPDIVVLVVEPV